MKKTKLLAILTVMITMLISVCVPAAVYDGAPDVIEITGTMDSDIVSDLKIIELKVFDENYLFLARRYDKGTNKNGKWAYTYEYYDVFEDYKIVSFTDLVDQRIDNREITEGVYLVKESSLNDYLSYYGYKDKEYTPKKLKNLIFPVANLKDCYDV